MEKLTQTIQEKYQDGGGGGNNGGTGEDIINSLPTVKARYEKSIASIRVEAKEPKNGIEKIEIIYKGEVIITKNNPKQEETFDISKYGSGEYKVKATAKNTGVYRYAWVNVANISDRLTKPVIALTPSEPDGQNGWYRNSVNVTITTDSPSAKEIHYRIMRNGITAENEADITYTETFTINTLRNNKNICMDSR